MSDQVTPQNATRADFMKQIDRLYFFLSLIADLPSEYNTQAIALAQEAITEDMLVDSKYRNKIWKVDLTEAQRDRLLRRGAMLGDNKGLLPPRETKGGQGMQGQENTRQEAGAAQEAAKQDGGGAPLKQIEMLDVKSSNIARIGHDGEKTLRVQFVPPKGYVSGDAWDYDGITPGEFIELYQSGSVGSTYNAMTKNRGIKGVKVIEKRLAA